MQNISLKKPYVSVAKRGGFSFGGDQDWFKPEKEAKGLKKFGKDNSIKGFGCGLVAASDIIRYLDKNTGTDFKSIDEYKKYVYFMEDRSFKVYYKLGIPGFRLSHGMNREFKLRNMSYKAKWGVPAHKLLDSVKEMLNNDIPVLMSVGPGMFNKERVDLYSRKREGYSRVNSAKDHYITVTGYVEESDGAYFEISSWGKKYYMKVSQYLDYVKKHDNNMFSNILYIAKI